MFRVNLKRWVVRLQWGRRLIRWLPSYRHGLLPSLEAPGYLRAFPRSLNESITATNAGIDLLPDASHIWVGIIHPSMSSISLNIVVFFTKQLLPSLHPRAARVRPKSVA